MSVTWLKMTKGVRKRHWTIRCREIHFISFLKVLRHKLQMQDDMEDEEQKQDDDRPAKSRKGRSKKRAKAPPTTEAPAGKDKVCIHGLSSTRCSR